MIKKRQFTIILLISGMGLLIGFKIIGNKINENGILIEAFWMLPIACLLIATAIVSESIFTISKKMKKYAKMEKNLDNKNE